MATKDIRLNYSTDNGYDILYPETDAELIIYDNSKSKLNATNVKAALEELHNRLASV